MSQSDASAGKVVKQDKTQNKTMEGKQYYIVKFADVPPEGRDSKFEIIGVNEIVQKSVPTETQNSSLTRSKRQIKTPKKLLDSGANSLKITSTRKTIHNKVSDRESTVLELPRITITSIDKDDLYIEMEIDAEFSVGALELVDKGCEKSKYGCKVSRQVTKIRHQDNVGERNIHEQMGGEILPTEIDTSDALEKKVKGKSLQSSRTPKKLTKKQKIELRALSKITQETESEAVKSGTKNAESEAVRSGTKNAESEAKSDAVKSGTHNAESEADKSGTKTSESEEREVVESGTKTSESEEREAVESGTDLDKHESPDEVMEEIVENLIRETADDVVATMEDIPGDSQRSGEVDHSEKTKTSEEAVQTELDFESEQLELNEVRKTLKRGKAKGQGNESKPKRKYNKNNSDAKAAAKLKPKRKYTKKSAYSHNNMHYTIVTNGGKQAFKCDYCGVEMQFSGNMRDHVRIHTGEKPFKCQDCGKAFASNNNLKCHMVVHSDERPYVCDICGFAFKQKGLMKIHRGRHNPESSRFTCHMCGKNFHSSTEVKKHMAKHTGEKNYECKICFKKFSQDSALARHRFVHENQKPHPCEYCEMSFTRKDEYQRHLKRAHSDINYSSIKTEKSQRSEIDYGLQDEVSEAADNLINQDIIYIQVDGTNCQMPYVEDAKGNSIVYESMQIPVQQDEIIIITEAACSELGKTVDFAQV